jgi:hypothetical protein
LSILDPGSKNRNKREGRKKFVLPLFVATNITKLKILLFFEQTKKKISGQFTKNYKKIFFQKVVKLSKNGFGIRDPEKNLFQILDPGVKKAPDPGSATPEECVMPRT